MKINCVVSDLLEFLEPACYVASKAMLKTNPYNDLITIGVGDDEIEFLSFNGMVSMQTNIKNLSVECDNFTVSGKGLITVNSYNLLKNIMSFDTDEKLEIKLSDESGQKELRISKANDLEEFQTLPCYNDDVSLPKRSDDKVDKSLDIDKTTFVECASKVNFALGFESKFLYWVMRVAGNKVRFAAGDNRRFAILDIKGDGVAKSKSKTASIMLPKEHTAILLKLLGKAKDSIFSIKESASKKSELFYQSIKFDNHIMTFSHVDPNIQWPDENKVLKKEIKTKFIVSAADWETVAKAVDAAFDGAEIDENKAEIVTLRTEFGAKLLHIEVNENHKISRKIPLLDYASESEEDLEFKVAALYLKDIFNKGEKDGKYQFEFGEAMEDVNGNKFIGPFMVRYYAKDKVDSQENILIVDNGTNWERKFLFFILPSK